MTPKISILTIGDELLNGEVADTNTATIGRILGARGYTLQSRVTVPDEESAISAALQHLAVGSDVVIVSGGLGPTEDDITARAAAKAFGRRLVLNDEALGQIRAFFQRQGLPMHPRNEKQALLPQKVKILPNPLGTAPGFCLCQDERDIFFLPGVPAEMRIMLEQSVLPLLLERSGGLPPREERILTVFGLSEPKAEEILGQINRPREVELAFGVDFPFVHAKLRLAGGADLALLEQAELAARKALGDFLFATGDETLVQNVARLLTVKELTLALAESCTGGLIAKLLTDIPGASAFLERGAVTYADQAKRDWLGVDPALLAREGAVSAACALAMARGARQAAGTDLAVAVTGIAGPDGGTPEKPIGTVYIALASAEEEQVKGYRFSGSRDQIRTLTACMALTWIFRFASTRQ